MRKKAALPYSAFTTYSRNDISDFFFLSVLEFELRASWLLDTLLLEPLHQPLFVLDIVEIGSCKLFARTGFEL
jgi:hypothetical protein